MKSSKVFTLPFVHSSFDYPQYYLHNQTSSTSSGSSSNEIKNQMNSKPFTISNHENLREKKKIIYFTPSKPSSNNKTEPDANRNIKQNSNTSSSSKNFLLNGKNSSSSKPIFVQQSSINSNNSLESNRFKINKETSKNEYPELSFIFSPSDFQKSYNSSSNSIRPSFLPLSTERKLHDKFFLFLFIMFILASIYINIDLIYFKRTNINLILNGHDDWGNVCGQINDPIKGAMWSGQNMINRKFMLLRLGRNNSINSICIENCTFNDYFKTAFNRCLPKPLLLNPMFNVLNVTKGFLEEILIDSLLCWREIIYLCSLAITFSFALLIIIGFFVDVIIWLILSGFCITLMLITSYFWSNWYLTRERNLMLVNTRQSKLMMLTEKSQENWLLFSVISTIITFIMIITTIYLRKSLRLISLLFKEASKAVASMPFILLLPFLTLASIFGTCVYLSTSIIYLKSNQYPSNKINSTLVDFKSKPITQYLIWFNIIIFLWMVHFLYACQHYVISACIVKWHYNSKKLSCPIIQSIIELLRYHLGSIALGSLLVTGIKLIRIILNKFKNFLNQRIINSSILSRFLKIILYITEKLIIYINKNAYIIIAIHGTSFNKSTKIAFKLLILKSFKITIVNILSVFLLFIGKIVIVLIVLLLGFESIKDKEEKLNYPWGPLLIPVLFSYFISHCFLTVYEMAVDTLFVCFCEDNKLEEIESESTDSNDLNQNWSLMSKKNLK